MTRTSLKTKLLSGYAASARHLRGCGAKFRDDKSGIAAIEFALIAPLMIMMYFGLAEIAQAISIDRKVSHGANVAGDLAAQVADIPADDMEEVISAMLHVMNINDTANVKIEVASYDMDPSDNPRLLGKATINGAGAGTLPAFDPSTLDGRILSQTSGVVVARVAYSFEPLKLRYFDTNINLSETFLLKPRRSASVQIGEQQGAAMTCTATSYDTVSCTDPTATAA